LGRNFFYSGFNLILAGMVVLVAAFEFEDALYYLIFAGILMDIYSILPFGIFTLSLFLTAVALKMLFLNFFTNRSFYSLIGLGIFGVLVYYLSFAGLSWISYASGLSDFNASRQFWVSASWQFLTMPAALILGFMMVNNFSRRFKPIFVR
jgi:cell shape-determining protein MreD